MSIGFATLFVEFMMCVNDSCLVRGVSLYERPLQEAFQTIKSFVFNCCFMPRDKGEPLRPCICRVLSKFLFGFSYS